MGEGKAATRSGVGGTAKVPEQAGQAAAKPSTAHQKGKDFTDLRTDVEMRALHQELQSIKPTPENFLYTPAKKRIAGSLTEMQKLSSRFDRDHGVIAVPIEALPGQWKLRVERVPPPPSLPKATQDLREMYTAMLRGERRKISLGIIGPEEAARINIKTGVDALLNKRELDTEWIRHAFERHGNEMTPGQVSITEQDFIRYGEILLDPHWISPGGKPNSVVYSRRYPDGTVYAMEQQIQGHKLEFRTLWKQAAGGVMELVLIATMPSEEE